VSVLALSGDVVPIRVGSRGTPSLGTVLEVDGTAGVGDTLEREGEDARGADLGAAHGDAAAGVSRSLVGGATWNEIKNVNPIVVWRNPRNSIPKGLRLMVLLLLLLLLPPDPKTIWALANSARRPTIVMRAMPAIFFILSDQIEEWSTTECGDVQSRKKEETEKRTPVGTFKSRSSMWWSADKRQQWRNVRILMERTCAIVFWR
jgi:hypothetical protein